MLAHPHRKHIWLFLSIGCFLLGCAGVDVQSWPKTPRVPKYEPATQPAAQAFVATNTPPTPQPAAPRNIAPRSGMSPWLAVQDFDNYLRSAYRGGAYYADLLQA